VKKRALLLAVFILLLNCGKQEPNIETEIAVPVSVVEIKPKSIEEFITSTGTVRAIKEVSLKSEISGRYNLLMNPNTGRPYGPGDWVAKGKVMIRLEDEEYENNIAIEAKRLNLDISKREYEKQKSLYEKGGVTLRELKNSELAYINAKYNYDNAILQIAKMSITAPFDGIIVDLPYYTPMVRVQANQLMVRLMNYNQLYLEVNLPAKEMGRVSLSQSVRITNYSLQEDTLLGKITKVSPAINAETRTFKVAMIIDNKNLIIKPGMFVKAEIIVARKDSAIVIPKDIILSRRRGKTVFIVRKGVAVERTITTGLENPEEVEVIKGLEENERLIIKGFEALKNRSRVKIIR